MSQLRQTAVASHVDAGAGSARGTCATLICAVVGNLQLMAEAMQPLQSMLQLARLRQLLQLYPHDFPDRMARVGAALGLSPKDAVLLPNVVVAVAAREPQFFRTEASVPLCVSGSPLGIVAVPCDEAGCLLLACPLCKKSLQWHAPDEERGGKAVVFYCDSEGAQAGKLFRRECVSCFDMRRIIYSLSTLKRGMGEGSYLRYSAAAWTHPRAFPHLHCSALPVLTAEAHPSGWEDVTGETVVERKLIVNARANWFKLHASILGETGARNMANEQTERFLDISISHLHLSAKHTQRHSMDETRLQAAVLRSEVLHWLRRHKPAELVDFDAGAEVDVQLDLVRNCDCAGVRAGGLTLPHARLSTRASRSACSRLRRTWRAFRTELSAAARTASMRSFLTEAARSSAGGAECACAAVGAKKCS